MIWVSNSPNPGKREDSMHAKISVYLVLIPLSASAVLLGLALRERGRPGSAQAILKTPSPVLLGSVDQAKKVPFTFVVPNTRWCLRIAERDKFLVNMKLTT